MKPRFALTLSHDKIELFHRSAGGWTQVGAVALDEADLAAALKSLRDKGTAQEPRGMNTVLVLPDDQILYTSSQIDPDDPTGLRASLDGQTPYAVDDLEFDAWDRDGETHLAVVARETLDEAEAFAVEHRFEPIAFSARARDGHPVWLGPTKAAAVLMSRSAQDKRDTLPAPGSVLPDPEPAQDMQGMDEPPAADLPDDAPPATPAIKVSPLDPPETRPTFLTSRDTPVLPGDAAAVSVAPRITLGGAKGNAMPPLASGRTGMTAAVAPALEPEPAEPDAQPTVVALPVPPKPAPPKPTAKPDLVAARPRPVSERPEARVTVDTPIATTTIVAPPPPANEAEALTVFGARHTQNTSRGAAPYLAYGLTAALLLLLGGAALWLALMFSDEVATLPDDPATGIDAPGPRIAAPEATVAAPATLTPPPVATVQADDAPADTAPVADDGADVALAALPPQTGDTGSAAQPATDPDPGADLGPTRSVAPALNLPTAPADQAQTASIAPTERTGGPGAEPATAAPELATRDPREQALDDYELTGVWAVAPTVPASPPPDRLDSLYLAALDPAVRAQDALALPLLQPDPLPFAAPLASPGPGLEFALDDRGLVTPTPEGTLSPDGVVIFAGTPPITPPRRPGSEVIADPAVAEAEAADALRTRLAAFRPRIRPGGLSDQAERAALGGLSRDDLAKFRPKPRPASVQDDAANSATEGTDGGEGTLVASLRPRIRPADKAAAVQKELAKPVAPAVPTASIAAAPRIPTSASVARQATLENQVNLRRMVLIGVYGTASDRSALVRTPSGRMLKLKVGDRLDGGRVAAIGDTNLRYVKNGRSLVLDLPG